MSEILYEKQGRIALVTINRPERRNALNRAAFGQLADAWMDFERDPELWVAVVTGAGDAFCAGGDLKEAIQFFADNAEDLASGRQTAGAAGYHPMSPLIAMLREVEIYKPIIAAVNGICVAGGMEMLLGTDIRIASERATFGIYEPRRGLFPGGGTTVRLPRQIPYCMAMEVLLTADPISAELAYEMGIVNRVVAHEEVLPAAMRFAETICKNGPVAVRAVKECVQRNLRLPLKEAFDLELEFSARVFSSDDAQEGLASFREKRPPVWKGR
ncbi:MAG: enoyl-CoA hydratase [Candidatus Binatota bacterium]|nr:enoyl-CoA hydratase [Candidatus Binatota bacterium]